MPVPYPCCVRPPGGAASAVRLGLLTAALTFASAVAAQARPDSTGLAGGVGGLAISYDDLLQEYRSFRPLPAPSADVRPDTGSAGLSSREVAEAVARAFAQRAPTTGVDGVQRLEIDGLIADETITRTGREFYSLFYRLWAPPPEAVAFSIEVIEQPAVGVTTAIRVQVNDELVYQSRLSPRADDLEEDVQQAVAAAYRRLQRGFAPPSSY